jgi:hypothetical protein
MSFHPGECAETPPEAELVSPGAVPSSVLRAGAILHFGPPALT